MGSGEVDEDHEHYIVSEDGFLPKLICWLSRGVCSAQIFILLFLRGASCRKQRSAWTQSSRLLYPGQYLSG